ncbi:MOSC domain-containing protein [soil metagenome]
MTVVNVTELWRYPVKSMGGERLTTASVGPTGIEHDRGWGVVDAATGNVLTARREPALLMATASVTDGELVMRTVDGLRLHSSADLSDWLARPVTLEAAGDTGGTYENPADAARETDWMSWHGPGGAWHDSARTRVSIVSTSTLGATGGHDVRRFRMNVVVDGADEDALVGSRIRIGGVEAIVTKQVDRCVMVTRPQPGLDRDLEVLRRINRERGGHLGIGTLVEQPGEIRIGDRVEVLDSADRTT